MLVSTHNSLGGGHPHQFDFAGLTPFGVASKLVCVELCGFDLRCILLIHAFVIAINVGGSMTNDYP